MAELKVNHRWERYAPSIGNNKELDSPFYFRVRAGLAQAELDAFFRRLVEYQGKHGRGRVGAEVFGELVEIGDEPLTLNGKQVTTLAEYLDPELATPWMVHELIGALGWHNSVEGTRESFSERPSGGDASTLFGYGRRQAAATSFTGGSETRP